MQTFFSRAAQSTSVGAEVARQVRGDWLGSFGSEESRSFVIWRLDLGSASAVKNAAEILGTPGHGRELQILETGRVLTLVAGAGSANAVALLAACE